MLTKFQVLFHIRLKKKKEKRSTFHVYGAGFFLALGECSTIHSAPALLFLFCFLKCCDVQTRIVRRKRTVWTHPAVHTIIDTTVTLQTVCPGPARDGDDAVSLCGQ